MPVISSLTDCPYIIQHDVGWPPPRLCSKCGGLSREAEEHEWGILISNVTVIYRLYFLGKVQRFISSDRLFKNTQLAGVAVRVGEPSGAYAFSQEEEHNQTKGKTKGLGPENPRKDTWNNSSFSLSPQGS